MHEANELQLDALAEIFNIGVGRAAASLSQIVRDEVELSAPQVVFLTPEGVRDRLFVSELDQLSLVAQDFTGPFDARAMLVFPEKNALVIVSHMLEGMVEPEHLSEFEQEAMCEVGNIILNACISALADMFDIAFEGSLPQYRYAERKTLDLLGVVQEQAPVILLVQVDLRIRKQSIDGHMLFLLSVTSLKALLESIDLYLAKQGIR